MRKKILATVLAASMALTMAPVLPVNTGTVASAEDVNETVGPEDRSAEWWSAFSSPFKLEQDEVLSIDFDNYGGAAVFNNYLLVFTNDGTTTPAADAQGDHKEYLVLRADKWSWSVGGNGGENKSLFGQDVVYTITCDPGADSATFIEIMQDAHVKMDVVRKGAWIKVSANIVSNTDATKSYEYTATLQTEEDADNYVNFTVDHSYMKINSVDRSEADPDLVIEPSGTNNPTPDNPTPDDPTPDDPTPDDPTPDEPTPAKKTMTVKVTAKKNDTKVTGTVSVKGATVKVKVGKKAYKKATVNGKKFTIKVAKLAKGTKVAVKATKSGYKAVTKTVTVK